MILSNSVVFISGGASGLGAACARRFFAAGAHVAIADLNESQAKALAAELCDSAPDIARDSARNRALACAVDVTDEASVATAIAAVRQRWSRIDAAVSCAGILVAQRTLGREGPHPLATFDKVVRVNLIGTFNVARLAAAAMADNPPRADDPENDGERGVIVNTASVAAYDGQIGQAAYSASKGGVAAMTLPLARDLGRHGIRVVAIAPGIFETPMMLAAPENVRQSLASQIPFPPRFGNPTEFASLVEHVFENRMLNGAVLRIDGGVRMGPK